MGDYTEQKKSKAAIAYEKIYKQIMTISLVPGQRLEEKHLMETLDIGRTPIREALMRLEIDMMVESQSGKGFAVKPVTLQSVRAVFETLSILEKGVAELAVNKENDDQIEIMRESNKKLKIASDNFDTLAMVKENYVFHLAYANCSQNEYLLHGLTAVRCETRRLAYLSFGSRQEDKQVLAEHYLTVIDEHNRMIECLENRDADSLKKIVDCHVSAFKKRIVAYLMG